MMMSEFIERTGFEPTYDEYEQIQDAYYLFDGDKDEFCKKFVAENGEKKVYQARAEEIERLRSQILEIEKQFKKDLDNRERKIEALTADLDKELDWRPSEGAGTNMTQERYEQLLQSCTGNHGDPHVMAEDEARQLVAQEFGFDAERIEIVTTVHIYEVNKYRQLRKAATYTRQPLYDATDYNYVRFNVRCAACTWSYEMVNGELEQYSC
jgi:hypothetical protein